MQMHQGKGAGWIAPVAVILCLTLLSAGCAAPSGPPVRPATTPSPAATIDETVWMDAPLTDLQGRGIFTIRSLAVRPVLVVVVSESCPSCIVLIERQLDEISRLPWVQKGIVTVVALDMDPGPGPGFVAVHRDTFTFTGYTARVPVSVQDHLLQDLGPFAVDPGQVPVILVCPEKDRFLLPPGVKTEPVLNATIVSRC